MLSTLKGLTLDGTSALVLAALSGLGALLARRRRAGPLLAEAALVLGLFALWMALGAHSIGRLSAARGRGLALLQAERWLHLAWEAPLQRAVLPHPLAVQAANYIYASLHFPAMIAFLLWAFLRHRANYAGVRWRVVSVTLVCLLISYLPVAPPRLVGAAHLVDTGLRYHQSVYAGTGDLAQLAAMPSVHAAWAVLIAWEVARLSSRRWVWLHPLLTWYVITVTGNHWVLDALAGAAIVVAVQLIFRWRIRPEPVAAAAPSELLAEPVG